ncbi:MULTISPECIES: xanthine dehydrogenase family protein molybdopterin-binding subunit [unclassified Mesorhizobium]|uniref:xanthine dehydrogenase family protein molybdopterin-binding subunit n=1 Tax=unclassified Mesorhizobium TaxID=325217 RepID=UPI000FDB3E51|nr:MULTISPECIES: xanthine dehydrogenase family protein molybdopterin-binding subunit [unclassified Mesorhizobium]TGR23076.1 xanthine dehydrogenase family protein molybdopterin-binding subunit [Mesorhizobium sp. M8A.F.Ca.ET.197.01.1.1]TGR39162.1 xanthine dehydrogenase family protein molybdopterin-binding subunit [bacterium M00.F.Ca.ET.199.01.1.1]TGR46756.1 xanthine dehydrogenase family protein molybdopterin-binding subunit [Mesorhizobium sp. M8A.F.Ca.ET.198.01.1.1]TGV85169.1 xanthine dehydrogena
MTRYLGKETPRVDGIAKVTGKAKYAAEFQVPQVAYGFLVLSTIARGRITTLDTREAEQSAGVIRVLTHLNAAKLGKAPVSDAPPQWAWPLQSDRVFFNGQPIALVVAETYEEARSAARLVKTSYTAEPHATELEAVLDRAIEEPQSAEVPARGDPTAALRSAAVAINAEYRIPIEHHNPMEPHAAIAVWEGERLTVFDKTQNVYGVREHLAEGFGIPTDNIRVISPFVGGAFGSSLKPNYYPSLTAMAARELKRPVKLALTRTQMFTAHGYRPETFQKVALGADRDGRLQAIVHEAFHNTSSFEPFSDNTTQFLQQVYACPNLSAPLKVAPTDLATPTWMRAPGAVSGMFALESAMDELAHALKIDPLDLRLINYAEVDPVSGKPFSSKALRECYRLGAERFGWKKRNPEPRSMRDGNLLIGWGMASSVWGAFQQPASASVTYRADGTASVSSATSDIGPGTYTVMTMIAAEFLGIDIDRVQFELGDTRHPRAPAQGGSWTTSSVGSAVRGGALAIAAKLLDLANKEDSSPLRGVGATDVEMSDGRLRSKADMTRSIEIAELMRRNDMAEITEVYASSPSPEREKFASLAHGAQFVEVKVDPSLGTVKVTRVIEITACGKILNPLASHSQEIGGVVWGIGMALEEATEIDHRYGRIVNANLQHYHVPVNADIHAIETIFVEEDDTIVNPLGVKGMGELGMVGIPAAIANAVFHATGERIRDLPITPEKLL